MRSPEEMQFIEVRNEYRKQIGALYGVTPLFMSDVGGMGNEGLQVVVTNRAIQRGQTVFNEKILPKIAEATGVTDYTLELVPNERRDEMAEAQLEAQKIANAMNMQAMGFKVILNEEGGFE